MMFKRFLSSIITGSHPKGADENQKIDGDIVNTKSKPKSPQSPTAERQPKQIPPPAPVPIGGKPPKAPPKPLPRTANAPLPTDQAANLSVESVPQRSVKISFPKGHIKENLKEDDVIKAASHFGEVIQVGMKDKCCVVLFSKSTEALQCCASFDELRELLPATLGYPTYKLRVKYMGASFSNLDDSYSSYQSSDHSFIVPQHPEEALVVMEAPLGVVTDSPQAQADEGSPSATDTHDLADDGNNEPLELEEFYNSVDHGHNTAPSDTQFNNVSVLLVDRHESIDSRKEVNIADSESESESSHRLQEQAQAENDGPIRSPGTVPSEGTSTRAIETESGKWKNAYVVSGMAQTPHYASHPQPQRFIDDSIIDMSDGDDSNEASSAASRRSPSNHTAIIVSKKSPREIQVGSPTSPKLSLESDEDTQLKQNVASPQGSLGTHAIDEDRTALEKDQFGDESKSSYDDDDFSEFDDACAPSSGAGAIIGVYPEKLNAHSAPVPADETAAGNSSTQSTHSKVHPLRKPAKPVPSPGVGVHPLRKPAKPVPSPGVGVLLSTTAFSSEQPPADSQKNEVSAELLEKYKSLQELHKKMLSKMRILEAESRVRSRERVEFEIEVKNCEENWATELTDLEIRNAELETECAGLRNENRKAKIEVARISGELSAANAAKQAAEALLDGAKARAERDSLSAVLAHQRLITVLDKQKESALLSLQEHKDELLQLREMHRKAVAEALDWKEKARISSTKSGSSAVTLHPTLNVMTITADVNSDTERVTRPASESEAAGDVEGSSDAPGGHDEFKELAVERSSRAAAKEEMEKYLSMLNASTGAPVAAATASSFLFEESNARKSFITTEARLRTTSEKIALDLSESRRKLESLRNGPVLGKADWAGSYVHPVSNLPPAPPHAAHRMLY